MKTNQLRPTIRLSRPRFPRGERPLLPPAPPAIEGELVPLLRDRHTGFLDLCLYPGMTTPPLPIAYPTAV